MRYASHTHFEDLNTVSIACMYIIAYGHTELNMKKLEENTE
jgi:hypothetical protein